MHNQFLVNLIDPAEDEITVKKSQQTAQGSKMKVNHGIDDQDPQTESHVLIEIRSHA